MELVAVSLAVWAYGSQSVFQTHFVPMAILLLCFCFLLIRKHYLGVFLCIITLTILSLSELTALKNLWPLPSVLSCVLGALCLSRARNISWFGDKKFRLKPAIISVFLGMLAFSGVALWVYLLHPSVEQIPFKIPSSFGPLSVSGLILVFAILNSFAEEFIFRGLALESMCEQSVLTANVIQSVGFGLLHFKGFPFGISGSLLAVFFALLMGYLKIKSGSFVYPWIAHFTVNIAMGLLLYRMT
jgi:membrane protease YdiL (CAAX protease family)